MSFPQYLIGGISFVVLTVILGIYKDELRKILDKVFNFIVSTIKKIINFNLWKMIRDYNYIILLSVPLLVFIYLITIQILKTDLSVNIFEEYISAALNGGLALIALFLSAGLGVNNLSNFKGKSADVYLDTFSENKKDFEDLIDNLEKGRFLNKIAKYWRLTVLFIAFYYAYLLTNIILREENIIINSLLNHCILNVLNITSTITFMYLYFIISSSIFNLEKFKYPKKKDALVWITIILVLAGIILIYLFRENTNINELLILVSIVIGVFGGLAIAMFTGRIDSKFTPTPPIARGLCYLYAVSMVLLPVITSHPESVKNIGFFPFEIKIAYFTILFLKVCFFSLVMWLFKSKNILLYILRSNIIRRNLDERDQYIKQHFPMIRIK